LVVGRWLVDQKVRLGHGNFDSWLTNNPFGRSARQLRRYKSLAEKAERQIGQICQICTSNMSVSALERALSPSSDRSNKSAKKSKKVKKKQVSFEKAFPVVRSHFAACGQSSASSLFRELADEAGIDVWIPGQNLEESSDDLLSVVGEGLHELAARDPKKAAEIAKAIREEVDEYLEPGIDRDEETE